MKNIKLSLAMLCIMGTINSGNIFFNAGGNDLQPKVVSAAKFLTRLPKRLLFPAIIVSLAYGECTEQNKESKTPVTPQDVWQQLGHLCGNAWTGGLILAQKAKITFEANVPQAILDLLKRTAVTSKNQADNSTEKKEDPATPGQSLSSNPSSLNPDETSK